MPQYIRAFVPGETFFFTVTLAYSSFHCYMERGICDFEWAAG
jgi:hypothetical protein